MFGWKLVRESPPPSRPQKRRRRVAPALLLVIFAVFIASIATADVILTYVATTTVGNTTSPFQFATGSNYGTGSALGLVNVNNCGVVTGAGLCPADELTTAINGVTNVGVTVMMAAELTNPNSVATTAHIASTGFTLVTPAVVLPTNLVCAYAIVTDAAVTPSTTPIPNEPTGCPATELTPGALTAGCPASTAGQTIIDLTDSTLTPVQSPTAWTCNIANPTAGGTVELQVTFEIYTSGTVAGTTLNTFGVQVTAP